MSQAAKKSRILLIDDSPEDADLIRIALRGAKIDCDVNIVDDGANAMALVRGKTKKADVPDLAILDLNLPKYDGFEILAAMRSNPAFSKVPVAVMSSSASERDKERAAEMGVAQFIIKPSELKEFLETGMIIKSLLGGSAQAA